MLIRVALASDAVGIADAHIRSIRELCGPSYEPSQIAAWVLGKRAELYLEEIANNPFFVAVLDGGIAGFSLLHLATGRCARDLRSARLCPTRRRSSVAASRRSVGARTCPDTTQGPIDHQRRPILPGPRLHAGWLHVVHAQGRHGTAVRQHAQGSGRPFVVAGGGRTHKWLTACEHQSPAKRDSARRVLSRLGYGLDLGLGALDTDQRGA